MRLNWNRLADLPPINGWPIDYLIRYLITEAAQTAVACGCDEPRACHHAGAAGLVALLRTIEHPRDCPHCKALAELNAAKRATAEEPTRHPND